MNRRQLLVSSSVGALSGVGGCLNGLQGNDGFDPDETESENDDVEMIPTEEIVDAACSHVPADAERVDYTARDYREWPAEPIISDGWTDEETEELLALIATRDEAEGRIDLERAGASPGVADGIQSFTEETDFDEQALLIWQTEISPAGKPLEVVGVTQPHEETIHAYTCTYANGPDSIEMLILLLRVSVSSDLKQAKLTNRNGVPRHLEGKIDTRESTLATE